MNDKPHLDEEALAELKDVMEEEFDVLIQTYLADSRSRIEAWSRRCQRIIRTFLPRPPTASRAAASILVRPGWGRCALKRRSWVRPEHWNRLRPYWSRFTRSSGRCSSASRTSVNRFCFRRSCGPRLLSRPAGPGSG